MNDRQNLALIGSGPSAIFVLQHLLDEAATTPDGPLSEISIFEQAPEAGLGMPYSPLTTDRHNRSNISPEEIPPLPVGMADWLRAQDRGLLEELGVERDEEITEDGVYSRLALGRYLRDQYRILLGRLADSGIRVREELGCRIVDIRRMLDPDGVTLETAEGGVFRFDRVIIATGHCWPEEDKPENGFYTSPWPIRKILPPEGEYHRFTVGTLGASLSAFDVVSSLAHRHGEFVEEADGEVAVYRPFAGTENFKIVMHSAEGLLPHLQFEQVHPMREIYRHISRDELLALRDAGGFLRLDTYFAQVCRPVLAEAFRKDGMEKMVKLLEDPGFGLPGFVGEMTAAHEYPDPFKGMRDELRQARKDAEEGRPTHWKEVMDDLMYTLNFHAELMPAEDHLKLRALVMPFLMNVVAAMPLRSAEMILALHDAGKLELVSGKAKVGTRAEDPGTTTVTVDDGGEESTHRYRMFIDCSGQKPVELDEVPFPSLAGSGCARRARACFADPEDGTGEVPEEKKKDIFEDDGKTCYPTGGVDVDPAYRLVDARGKGDSRIMDIAFPHTSGLRPYSYGLQACNDTARLAVEGMLGKG